MDKSSGSISLLMCNLKKKWKETKVLIRKMTC